MECERKNNHCKEKQFLERSYSVKEDFQNWKVSWGPNDVDVDSGES